MKIAVKYLEGAAPGMKAEQMIDLPDITGPFDAERHLIPAMVHEGCRMYLGPSPETRYIDILFCTADYIVENSGCAQSVVYEQLPQMYKFAVEIEAMNVASLAFINGDSGALEALLSITRCTERAHRLATDNPSELGHAAEAYLDFAVQACCADLAHFIEIVSEDDGEDGDAEAA